MPDCRDRLFYMCERNENPLDPLTSIEWRGRAIMLVDLDAFFASVEQLDHPGWRGKPVIVGGDPERRGVVSTASYEARTFGVHSAMPSSTAARLCPDAIWTRGNYARYREVSNQVMDILFDETPFVQQVSIDEAFLDVSPTSVNKEHPVEIAHRIQNRVDSLGVSCSIGLGTTKAIAKLASDMDKPKGLTVVLPGSEQNFLNPLPVRALSGIGRAAEAKLKAHGIETLGQLAQSDDEHIECLLGKMGLTMLMRARAAEEEPIVVEDERKSVSNEMSFAKDLTVKSDIEAAIATAAAKVARRLRKKDLKGNTITLKVRYSDRSVRSAQRALPFPSDDEYTFIPVLGELLETLWQPGIALRLVGVAVTGFDVDDTPEQLTLFDVDADGVAERSSGREGLLSAADKVKDRFGENSLRFGREFLIKDQGTGSASKNPADYK